MQSSDLPWATTARFILIGSGALSGFTLIGDLGGHQCKIVQLLMFEISVPWGNARATLIRPSYIQMHMKNMSRNYWAVLGKIGSL